jgi:hypothetical protein
MSQTTAVSMQHATKITSLVYSSPLRCTFQATYLYRGKCPLHFQDHVSPLEGVEHIKVSGHFECCKVRETPRPDCVSGETCLEAQAPSLASVGTLPHQVLPPRYMLHLSKVSCPTLPHIINEGNLFGSAHEYRTQYKKRRFPAVPHDCLVKLGRFQNRSYR